MKTSEHVKLLHAHLKEYNMAIAKKINKASTTNVPKKQVIKVNPYENPENVLELMANICSAVPSADMNIYWNVINDAYNKEVRGKSLNNYLKENRGSLLNKDFEYELKEFCRDLSWNLATRENTEHTQIVVAGGFSSGKSSFLNRLTNCTNLLPTGVEPVSVVKTYLYCSCKNRTISVKGVNQKNVLVNLNPGVLQAIQHAKKSNIYLASVLDKLFVEIPSQELDGLVFIDTPGYNNTEKANQSNGKTDRETALEALGEGNVLFWLVDCERGTTVTNDIEIIKQFKGKKVFIFNKADKKGYQESVKIVEEAAKVLYNEFPQEDIIDIIAYSTLDNKIYCSKNNMTLNSIVREAKKSGNGNSEMELLKELIGMLFDDEISANQDSIKNIEESYKEKLNVKNQYQKYYQDAKVKKDLLDVSRDMLINNYNELLGAINQYYDSSCNALNTMAEFINAMYKWDATDHACFDNTLVPKINSYNNRHDRLCKVHNAINYTWYEEEYRRRIIEEINDGFDMAVDRSKDYYEDACRECENVLDGINREQILIKDMEEYRRVFMTALEKGIKLYQQQNKATSVHNDENVVPNVFDCIKKDDYKLFLHSFEDGVDLSVCNVDGYNPLTFAVSTGNNMMVQFMLDHDADPSIKDKRGYNAFHTAVENQYRDICEMLLDVDPDLIETKTVAGESVEDLANKQAFVKWIKKEIDNAL